MKTVRRHLTSSIQTLITTKILSYPLNIDTIAYNSHNVFTLDTDLKLLLDAKIKVKATD